MNRVGVFGAMLASLWMMHGAAGGAVIIESGSEAAFWASHAIVICELVDDPVQVTHQYRVLQNPIRVKIRSVVMTEIPVPTDADLSLYIYVANSELPRPKGRGSVIIACIERDGDRWYFNRNGLDFFPHKGPVEELDPSDAAAQDRIVKEIQRRHATAYKSPSANPTSAPADR